MAGSLDRGNDLGLLLAAGQTLKACVGLSRLGQSPGKFSGGVLVRR